MIGAKKWQFHYLFIIKPTPTRDIKLMDKFFFSILSFDSFFYAVFAIRSGVNLFGPKLWRLTAFYMVFVALTFFIKIIKTNIGIVHSEGVQEIQYRFSHHRRTAEVVLDVLGSVMLLEIPSLSSRRAATIPHSTT